MAMIFLGCFKEREEPTLPETEIPNSLNLLNVQSKNFCETTTFPASFWDFLVEKISIALKLSFVSCHFMVDEEISSLKKIRRFY